MERKRDKRKHREGKSLPGVLLSHSKEVQVVCSWLACTIATLFYFDIL